MNNILRISALVLAVGAAAAVAVIVNRSTDSIDEETENDKLVEAVVKTLPEGLTVFSDSGTTMPPMWEVTAADGSKLYLVGTIHSLSAQQYPLSQKVGDAFSKSDALAVEILNVDLQDAWTETESSYKTELPEGDTLKAHLPDDVYTAISERMKSNGADIADYEKYYPWVLVQEPYWGSKPDPNCNWYYSFDRISQIEANIEGKKKYSVETIEAKNAYYPEMPDDMINMLLLSSCNNDTTMQPLIDAWVKGDIDTLYEMAVSDAAVPDEYKDTWAEYIEYSITERNKIMTAKAEGYLSSDETVFMAVGSAHCGGEQGIPALLAEKGYTVTKIE